MLNRVLIWIGGALTVLFAIWLIADLVINGVAMNRLPVIGSAVGTLAGLSLMAAAVVHRRKRTSAGRSVSLRGDNSGIVSLGDNATNMQHRREPK
ncbi:hypothetical protein ASD13_03065 [Microbacterium sp. Root1433D1]|uniref:hypothetical protein n=1 Tax=Microbacterium sp. Root1433D1 TaxID=1736463 RepID=UPI0006F298AF|nr:hypothetical protein [Microbacterium sp. Root1433D1]KQY77670.1 hypothetical protein ASD13_03065 [Microbacterium sp. Root1433D1]